MTKNARAARKSGIALVLSALAVFFVFLRWTESSAGGKQLIKAAPTSKKEALRLGERMYRDGILPSGEPMQAYIKGDTLVLGTTFTCVSCHLRSGLGSIEGGVITLPTNGNKLFQPLEALYKGVEQKYFRRPAYTDASLAEVIRSGTNPSGEVLNDVMPRYILEGKDMALLILYLKSLSSEFSPGYAGKTLRFATIITDDINPEEREAMLAPLGKYISIKNSQASLYESSPRHARMAKSMRTLKDLPFLRLSLSLWVLKGAPETWRSQLEEYYRKEPVFAFLGGITKGEWEPIHRFSEANHIPCLLPITDFPVISATDWYTLYFSKGYYQEGETTARYLNGMNELLKGKSIVQIVRVSREGFALSDGFQNTWKDLGHSAPKTITLNAGEKLAEAAIEQILAKEKPTAVILWVGTEDLPALEILAAGRNRPGMVFVSSSYLGKSIWTLPEQVRDFTYITYPFTFSQDVLKSSMAGGIGQDDAQKTLSLKNITIKDNKQKISNLTNSLIEILTTSLMDMRGNYYRDNFFDVISMIMDQQSPVYGRLSFGPGQRYASKGCYIVQLTKGPGPELIKKSGWVIH